MKWEELQEVAVDAYRTHNTTDTDFGIIGFRTSDPVVYNPQFYIPEGQLWFSHRHRDEIPHLIRYEKKMQNLSGEAYYERREQIVRDNLRRTRKNVTDYIVEAKYRNGLVVAKFNGPAIRREIDPDFLGGHNKRYSYMPPGIVGIDDTMDPRDHPPTELHEEWEYRLMLGERLVVSELELELKFGRSLDYDEAHAIAKTLEEQYRRRYCGAIYVGDFNWPNQWSDPQVLASYLAIR